MQTSPRHGTTSIGSSAVPPAAGDEPGDEPGGEPGGERWRAPVVVRPVARPDLLAWVNAGPAKVVCVVAGAGWGKSTLIDQWRTDPGRAVPLAVMNADRWTADPVEFLSRIVASLAVAAPGPEWEVAARLLGRQNPDMDGAVLPALCRAFAGTGPVALAIDDLHLVTNPACHVVLAALIDRMPAGNRFLLASRKAVPLALGRLRAAGRLVELGPRQLSLDAGQAGELIAAATGTVPAEDVVTGILRVTEGWAAAVFLAARLLRDSSAPDLVLARLASAHGHVAELFAEEVLSGLTADQARTLTRSAVLDRFSSAMVRAVAGGELPLAEPGAVGELFLVPLDVDGRWFRHHHLLQAVLQRRLEQAEPEEIPALHRRAAEWLRHEGRPSEAIGHALAGGDAPAAAELIGAGYPVLLNTGRRETVSAWLKGLGEEAIAANAPAAIAAAWTAALGGDRAAVGQYLAAAERAGHPGPLPDGTRCLESAIALVRAMFGFDGFAVMAESARAAAGWETDATSPWHAMACLTLGHVHYLSGEPQSAMTHLEAGFSAQAAMPLIRIGASALLALCHHDLGHPDQAEQLVEVADRLVADYALQGSPQAALVPAARAVIAAGRGDFTAAGELLATAHTQRQSVPGISPWPDVLILVLHARVRIAAGDHKAANQLLADAEALVRRLPDVEGPHLERIDDLRRRSRAAARRPDPLEPLSAAEVALVQFLPTRLTLVEIAGERGVSINTVKTQARAVYRKLGADGRDSAVEIARRQGLIP